MSKLITASMLAEIKQYIVDNLEYETKADESALPDISEYGEIFNFANTGLFSGNISLDMKDFVMRREKSFSEELNDLVNKSGKSNSEIYTAAQMDRRLFSKICNKPDYHPTKSTALALAIALELTLEQTKQFISRAGYALTRSSVVDLVVEFFINKKIYNVMAINEALYELDQPLLGNAVR